MDKQEKVVALMRNVARLEQEVKILSAGPSYKSEYDKIEHEAIDFWMNDAHNSRKKVYELEENIRVFKKKCTCKKMEW